MNNIEQPFHVQAMKIRVADLLREYQEIKSPTLYHKIAYRYEIDEIIDDLVLRFNESARIGEQAIDFIQKEGVSDLPDLPPIIMDRIAEIIDAFVEDNPDASAEDKNTVIGVLFSEGGEFDGLINEDKTINKEWLEQYLENPDHLPRNQNIPLTPEMEKDWEIISARTDLTDDEKNDLFSDFFFEGGKYEGYLQKDGTVDASQITKQ